MEIDEQVYVGSEYIDPCTGAERFMSVRTITSADNVLRRGSRPQRLPKR